MLAWINGIMVQGTPEEIEHYRKIAQKKTKYFEIEEDGVPEHVKQYDKHKQVYVGNFDARVWF